MGRVLKIATRPEHERTVIDRTIREHRYLVMDNILSDLEDQGIKVSRSSLHRYVSALKQKDATLATPEEGTIVTIVERATGEVRLVKCPASAESIATLIMTFRPNQPIS